MAGELSSASVGAGSPGREAFDRPAACMAFFTVGDGPTLDSMGLVLRRFRRRGVAWTA
jgi:hypothetical protein